ncbi:MAG: DUF4055 domain-containing protein [Alphaproteobacteria bacterium]
MTVTTKHQCYEDAAGDWQLIRDCIAGSRAIKEAGTLYLPQLEGMNGTAYESYKQRAQWFGATSRTLEGLQGAIFRKPPVVEVPDKLQPVVQNVDGRGTGLETFGKTVVREVIATGRLGILVDLPADASGRPFLACYEAESIVNWRVQTINGKPVCTLVVLHEPVEEADPDNPFGRKVVDGYRVLRLDLDGNRPVYTIDRWRKVADRVGREDWALVESTMPTRRGESLDFLPFVVIGPTDLGLDVAKSPILDLAEVNLSHFRTSADLEHGAHFTALPTVWVAGGIAGAQPGSVPDLHVGAGAAWQLDQGSTCGMLEFRGQGLNALEKRLERKEAHLAVLGARLLEDQKNGVEAAETVSLRHRGENSLLASIANTVSRGLSQALSWASWWSYASNDPNAARVSLNTDFSTSAMSAADVVALVKAWQSGGIGGRTLHHNLEIGERLPPGMTFDEWIGDIEEFGAATLSLLPSSLTK